MDKLIGQLIISYTQLTVSSLTISSQLISSNRWLRYTIPPLPTIPPFFLELILASKGAVATTAAQVSQVI